MTSMPASRNARAMILAPRSWPSRPGFATTTRILRLVLSTVGTVGFCRAKIELGKDGGRPHTQAVCGRLRTPSSEDWQPAERGRTYGGKHFDCGWSAEVSVAACMKKR